MPTTDGMRTEIPSLPTIEVTAPKPGLPSDRLQAASIIRMLERLERRIRERFPTRTLGDTCHDLTETAKITAERVDRACQPYVFLRLCISLIFVAVTMGLVFLSIQLWPAVSVMWSGADSEALSEAAQALEAAVNLGLLAALAVWSLSSQEDRMRRKIMLRHLHELRGFAHVIDMHQLNKDPVLIADPQEGTASSPDRSQMSEYDLGRYLDYCTEALSLIGKLAALYSEKTDDLQTIEAATDVETLTTQLGRKIWQKISLIGVQRAKQKTRILLPTHRTRRESGPERPASPIG